MSHSISVSLPRARLTGCSCLSPLAHFFIHHGGSSIKELHPFTTITHLASKDDEVPSEDDKMTIQFLFRKAPSKPGIELNNRLPFKFRTSSRLFRRILDRPRSIGWTARVTSPLDQLVDTERAQQHIAEDGNAPSVELKLRLEGPYFSPADPSRYHTVICLVAGTGISGAIAISGAFIELQKSRVARNENKSKVYPLTAPWQRCIILWSVRENDVVNLPFLESCAGLELRPSLTGLGKQRMNISQTLTNLQKQMGSGMKMWVYISGPRGFIEASKTVCKSMTNVDFHAAGWEI